MCQRLASVCPALGMFLLGLGAYLFFLSSLQTVTLPTTGRVSLRLAEERPQDWHAGLGAQDLGSNAVCDIGNRVALDVTPLSFRPLTHDLTGWL